MKTPRYSGKTFISGGTLQIGSVTALGTGTNIQLAPATTLDFAGATLTNSSSMTIFSANDNNASTPAGLTIAAAPTITNSSATAVTFSLEYQDGEVGFGATSFGSHRTTI